MLKRFEPEPPRTEPWSLHGSILREAGIAELGCDHRSHERFFHRSKRTPLLQSTPLEGTNKAIGVACAAVFGKRSALRDDYGYNAQKA